jgi:dipeptidyl-peptidase-4
MGAQLSRRFHAAALVLLLTAPAASAQQQRLTLEDIYGPDKRLDFSGTQASDIGWLDDARYVVAKRRGRDREWQVADAATGRSNALFDTAAMSQKLAALPGVTREEASLLARGDLTLNPAKTGALLTIAGDLYFYDFANAAATRLTNSVEAEEEAAFSPDGKKLAFVRGNDLLVVDLATQRERRLTADGTDDILNGKLDWVYQEELYGRNRFRAFWWSPDSKRIAFLQIDERPVPKYTVTDHIPYRPMLEVTGYPKSGDPNPKVRVGVVNPEAEAEPSWIDLSAYAGSDVLVVDVDWSPDSANVVFQVQDREQTWLDLNAASGGSVRRILRETTKAWVSRNGNPVWLKDGSFLWLSERSGFNHIYHYRTDGSLVRQVTNGRWEVRTLHGVDDVGGWIYFAATERSPIAVDLYRVKLDASSLIRLSQNGGTHRASFSPAFTHYLDTWSSLTIPPQLRLHRADGAEIRVIDANPAAELAGYKLSKPELLRVQARDGALLDALMIKPPDFDPSKRYPVFQHTYGGPAAPRVVDRWDGSRYLFHQLLAQQGIIVWICDNRSASGSGVESVWPIYGRLGELELRDIEDGVAWLKQQPYVDGSRIMIEGWSYGGFMSAYALTHSTSFAGGIVGAPVTDWRNYDTIYTERYMKMPQNNREGYAVSSPARAAARLHGKLLLLHGLTDDNVHVQNSVQFAYELQKAGKPFEMMMYPRSRHGFDDARLTLHLRRTMLDFVVRTIGGASLAASPTASR